MLSYILFSQKWIIFKLLCLHESHSHDFVFLLSLSILILSTGCKSIFEPAYVSVGGCNSFLCHEIDKVPLNWTSKSSVSPSGFYSQTITGPEGEISIFLKQISYEESAESILSNFLTQLPPDATYETKVQQNYLQVEVLNPTEAGVACFGIVQLDYYVDQVAVAQGVPSGAGMHERLCDIFNQTVPTFYIHDNMHQP